MRKLVLALLVAGTLTACGGGGGKPAPEHNHGGSNAGSHTNNANVTPNNANTTQPDKRPDSVDLAFIFDADDPIEKHKRIFDNSSLMHLNIDGKVLNLNVVNNSEHRAFKRDLQTGTLVSSSELLQHARVGYARVRDDVLFLLGTSTKDMPKMGHASYKGFGVLNDDNLPDGRDEFSVDFTAQVDFGAGKVHGKLGKHIQFNSNIVNGHYFEGDGAQGAFFGPEAGEMAGVFERDNGREDLTAIFGAKKQ